MTTSNDSLTDSGLPPTTAKWVVDEGLTVRGAKRHYIKSETGNVAVGIIEGFTKEQARLIAAAPDLLEELHKWIDEDVVIERYLRLCEQEQIDDEDARWMQRYEQTRTVIAKAEKGA